jgi:hypothetical protein
VWRDPREMRPFAATTATLTLAAVGQDHRQVERDASAQPAPWFFVST